MAPRAGLPRHLSVCALPHLYRHAFQSWFLRLPVSFTHVHTRARAHTESTDSFLKSNLDNDCGHVPPPCVSAENAGHGDAVCMGHLPGSERQRVGESQRKEGTRRDPRTLKSLQSKGEKITSPVVWKQASLQPACDGSWRPTRCRTLWRGL